MGRPSRKGTATAITFEDQDGEILYFSIDNRGKSNLIFRKPNMNFGYSAKISPKILTPSSSSDNLSIIMPKLANSCDKTIISVEKQPKYTVESDKFDLFLEKINRRIDIDDILRNNQLSFNYLPPITA